MKYGKWRVVSGEWRVGKRLRKTASEPRARATGGTLLHPTPSTQHPTPLVRALALAALFSIPCSLFPVPSLAQGPAYRLGRIPTQEEIKAWDISIGPEGKELPPGRGTVQEGEKLYAQRCAKCHGPTGTEVKFLHGALVGGFGSLTTLQPLKTVGSYYPYPTTIYDYINRSMPFDKPSSLSPDQVYSVVAFLFFKNGIIKDADVMDAQTLPNVQMPNRNGFFPAKPEWKLGYWQPYFEPQPIPRAKKSQKPSR